MSSYADIKIILKMDGESIKFDNNKLTAFKIVKTFNDHAQISFSGEVTANQNQYFKMAAFEVTLAVYYNPANTLIFNGVLTHIEARINYEERIIQVEIKGKSFTHYLDAIVNNRAFQDQTMTYQGLVDEVTRVYPKAMGEALHNADKPIETFTLQYQETDWQFLKRIASHFHTGLIPDLTSGKPKFYLGLPEGTSPKKLDNFHYSVGKNIADFWYSSENYLQNVTETDFIYYEVEADEILDLGSEVEFKGNRFYVREAIALMNESILKHYYTLAPKIGLSQNNIYNRQIVGVSVGGKVIDVAKDNVRVHLEIDEEQNKDEAYWFPYSSVYTAEGNSGWYCMPELGDYVRIYFPDKCEENAIALNSVRQDNGKTEMNKVDNPDIKYFRTKSGKELMFSPEEIVLTGKDNEVFLRINEKEGIEIFSTQPVKVTSSEGIEMDCQKKIVLAAQDEINISCKGSKILMDGSTNISGSKVKIN